MYSSSTDYKTSHRSVGGGGDGGVSAGTGVATRTATSGGNDRLASNSSSSKLVTSYSRSKSVDDISRGEATGAAGGIGESSNISYHRTSGTTGSGAVGSTDYRRSASISRDYKSQRDLDSLSRDKGISLVRRDESSSVSHGRAARSATGGGYSYKGRDAEVCTDGVCGDRSDDRLIVEEGGVDHRSSKNQYRIVGRITRSPSPEARYKTSTTTTSNHHTTDGGGGRSRDVSGGGIGSTSIEYVRSNTDINTGGSRRDYATDRRELSCSRDVDRGRFTKDGMAILGGSSRDFRSGPTCGGYGQPGYGDGGGIGGRSLPAVGQDNARRDPIIVEVDGGRSYPGGGYSGGGYPGGSGIRGGIRGGGGGGRHRPHDGPSYLRGGGDIGYRRPLDAGRRGVGGGSRPTGGYDRYMSPEHPRNMSYDDDRMGPRDTRGRPDGKGGSYPHRNNRPRGRSSTYHRGPRQSIRRSRSMNDLLPRTPSPFKRQGNVDLNDSFPVCRRFPNCSVCAIDIPQNQNVRWFFETK